MTFENARHCKWTLVLDTCGAPVAVAFALLPPAQPVTFKKLRKKRKCQVKTN